jgi:hypothetical protein
MMILVKNPSDLDLNKIVIKKPCIAGFSNGIGN